MLCTPAFAQSQKAAAPIKSEYKETKKIKKTKPHPTNLYLTVAVGGLPKDMADAVSNNLSIIQYADFAEKSIENLELIFSKSEDEINSALIPFGFYHPVIKPKIEHEGQFWNINYDITLGPPMLIDKLNIQVSGQAKSDKKFHTLLAQLPIKKGEVLTQNHYKKAKSKLIDLAFDRGYFNASLTKHKIFIAKADNQATIDLNLNSKKRSKIKEVSIQQKEFHFDKSFIQKFLKFKPGEYFNMQRLTDSQNNLQSSPYFSSVSITPQTTSKNIAKQSVPIKVDLIAKKPVTYTVGAGYGSFTGPRVLGGVILRHLTKSGQYAKFNIEASPINTTFLGEYIIPGKDPVNDYYSVNAQQSFINTIPYGARQTTFGIDSVHKFGRLTNTIGLRQFFIRYNTQSNNSIQNAHYLVPTWIIQYNHTQPDGFWKSGYVINNALQAALKSVTSSNTFVRNMTSIQYSLPLMKQWNRLLFNANFGALMTQDINNLAAPFRFYAGGVGNLLGYQYLSQGPVNAQNQLTGGKYLTTVSAGIEQRVYDKFSVITYFNLGNASNNLDMSDVEIKRAAGFGFGYKSPLGPLQIFFTRALNPGNQHWRFDFSVGVNF